ncbi:(2,3-dihydroxybenzoyl)adenylate synthase [Brevibacterium atlanticum]|uniref:(2,3-dihydroxybenzoyl)adenylate synthase n=1 Tax=Brevibacterium atlanticum TaxID=2697563 RepID=UPI001420CE5D|nr:AMP-binding protein [Brevibacterium atlanticum]
MTSPSTVHTVPWPAEIAAEYRSQGLWRGKTLFTTLLEVAEQLPEKIALVDGDVRISYRELVDRAEAGARRLLDLGLAPDDRILVQLPNCWQFVVLTFACARAGIVPVMALAGHREVELSGIAEVSESRAIVVPDTLKDFDHRALARIIRDEAPDLKTIIVSGQAGQDVSLDELLAPSAGELSELDHPESSSVALFLLSGGTTGLPKLISRTHDDYELNARLCADVAGIDVDAVYLVCVPASHNFALACPGILGVLFAGGTVVTLPSPQPKRVLRAIETEGVTITAAVPAVVQRWLEHVEQSPSEIDLSTLRTVQVGGSRLPDEIARRVTPLLGATLQQVFGMAEGLINMTRLDDPLEVITTTQGRPVSELDEVRIVGPDGETVADGQEGLIYTRGPYTPRGYYRAPEANAKSFVDGWYGSGDIVVRRPDGNLVVHGRDKDIINRGGEKISAEEIESLVYRLPQVELAAVVAMPDHVLGERLCLYVTLQPGAQASLEDVRAALTDAGIAEYKLPERLEIVEEIPMTKVGKINKKELRDDIRQRTSAEA